MSNLSNLYISESYYGVVNLYDSTEPFASQSEAKINFTDGVGESLGLSVTDTKDIVVDNNLIVSTSVEVLGTISGSVVGIGNVEQFSQSVDFRLDQLETDTGSQDARIDQLEIFSQSQDLINQGYNTFTQSYYVDSSSVDLRLDELESFSSSLDTNFVSETEFANYSSSVSGGQYIQDQRLDSIESFTSSLTADFVTDLEYSASIAVVTGSLITQIDTKLDTGSFNVFSSSVATTDLNQQNQINSLISVTGSYATTGSNTFSGSINGEVISLSVVSSTASIDCSNGNFFTITLPSGSTQLTAVNIKPGQTIAIEITQNASGNGNIQFESMFNFAEFNQPVISSGSNNTDVMSFISFGTTKLYGVIQNNFN